MPDARRIATAIDLRVRQPEAQGTLGPALANHMLGHMRDLQRIYDMVSDRALLDLCRRFPGFHRYASLMEAMSETNQEMTATSTHPYADLPQLPEPLKASLTNLLHGGVELEREFQADVDAGRAAHGHEAAVGRRPREAGSRIPLLEPPAPQPGVGATGGQGGGRADRVDGPGKGVDVGIHPSPDARLSRL